MGGAPRQALSMTLELSTSARYLATGVDFANVCKGTIAKLQSFQRFPLEGVHNARHDGEHVGFEPP